MMTLLPQFILAMEKNIKTVSKNDLFGHSEGVFNGIVQTGSRSGAILIGA